MVSRKRKPTKMPDFSDEMLSVQRDLGRIMEALTNAENNRQEMMRRSDRQSERTDQQTQKIEGLKSAINGLDQTLKSLTNVTTTISMEKCGERLERLETLTQDLPKILFWSKIIGTGMSGTAKIFVALVSSGALGALIVKVVSHYWP